MGNYRYLTVLLGLMLLAGGCSRAVSPLAQEQERFFANVSAVDPATDRALTYAKYYTLAGRHDLAAAELEASLQKNPHNPRLLNALGNSYDQAGNYRRAQETYQRILTQDADNVQALNNLGYSHYLAGDLPQAEKIFQELLAKHPDSTIARNNLGLVWCRQGKQQEALALWEKKDGPDKAQIKLSQVLAFIGRGGNAKELGRPAPQVAAVPPPAASGPAVQPETLSRQEKPQADTLPSRPLAAIQPLPKVKTAEVAKTAAGNAASPGVKVEEVAMIIQPASYTPPPQATPASPLPAMPALPKRLKPTVTTPASPAEETDQTEFTLVTEPQPVKPWRRTPRYRMITVPPPELTKKVKPLREYITRTHSYQSLNTPANPELAVY